MVARRMVASALGVKVAVNPEKREREREELERARGTYTRIREGQRYVYQD